MLGCMMFLRFVTLVSAVAVVYSDGSHHRRHRLDLLPSQQLATPKTSPYGGKVLQNELDGSGGSVKRTGFLAVVEGGASGGDGSVSLPTVREASDRSRAEENTGQFHQLVGNARRSRAAAESKAPTPAPAKAGTSPLAPTAKVLVPTAEPIATEPPATDPAASATPTPLRETPGPTPAPAELPPTMEPSPLGASPAPTAVPAATAVPATLQPTTEPTLVLETPSPTAVSPTLVAATLPAATPAPAINPTSTPAEMPATPPPAIEPTGATDIDHSPAPQTPEGEVSPTSPESTPKPTAAGGGVTDADNASDAGSDKDTDDKDTDDSVKPQAGGSDGGDEFVVGTGLDSGEKQKLVLGASVIGSLAVALVAAACAAKLYNAKLSGLDDDEDYEYGGLAKGRPGRLQTKNALPTYRVSPGSRTMDI